MYPIAKFLLRKQGSIPTQFIIACPQDTLHNSDSMHVANRTRLYLCWYVSLVCWCSTGKGTVAHQLLCLVPLQHHARLVATLSSEQGCVCNRMLRQLASHCCSHCCVTAQSSSESLQFVGHIVHAKTSNISGAHELLGLCWRLRWYSDCSKSTSLFTSNLPGTGTGCV